MNKKKGNAEVLMCRFIEGICGSGRKRIRNMMHPDIVWIWNDDEAFLIGAEKVWHAISGAAPVCGEVTQETFTELYEGERCCVVVGKFRACGQQEGDTDKPSLFQVTGIWIDMETKPKLKHIHLSHANRRLLPENILRRKRERKEIRYEIKDRENVTHRLRDLDIFYIESRKNYLIWHCRKFDITIRGTLISYQERLSPAFLRIHRSYIVNMNYVVKINRCYLKLMNGDEIQIPAKKYGQVKDTILSSPEYLLITTKREHN